ncbi:cyclic nucleotide-binding protein [Flavobacterium cheongpyeongense]|jgi:CRP-like cAMP-binding protein|uniref:Cyclic nucleotide-binding protein n=1 Tax=Flavobacterium cheongpyeongense TaxID=2212651 RepID=A0A2V4BTH4_9FLAO|nr:Crp/Fnr family transcriptional regulator [Flavobacterium cheongpyeongense]PXY42281.1 cyclic nucleotide-binding protein [Flavobacterium cheongpyeongense]
MIDILIQHINSKINNKLTESDISLLSEVFHTKKLRKHQYLIQSGEVCKIAAFVVKGALKKYTIDNSGKENILELYIENWWAGDKESFMIGTPTPYYIDAYEDSELLVITKDDFVNILSKLSFYSELNQSLTERQSFQLMKRLHSSQTFTAEQKLDELQNTYPEFFQRFPKHIIASYLGMTKETISRIRSNSSKK